MHGQPRDRDDTLAGRISEQADRERYRVRGGDLLLLAFLWRALFSLVAMVFPRHCSSAMLFAQKSGAHFSASCERLPEWLPAGMGSECPPFLKRRGASTKSVTPESDVDTLHRGPAPRLDWPAAAKVGLLCSRLACTETDVRAPRRYEGTYRT